MVKRGPDTSPDLVLVAQFEVIKIEQEAETQRENIRSFTSEWLFFKKNQILLFST